jgi:hypothetical protein
MQASSRELQALNLTAAITPRARTFAHAAGAGSTWGSAGGAGGGHLGALFGPDRQEHHGRPPRRRAARWGLGDVGRGVGRGRSGEHGGELEAAVVVGEGLLDQANERPGRVLARQGGAGGGKGGRGTGDGGRGSRPVEC